MLVGDTPTGMGANKGDRRSSTALSTSSWVSRLTCSEAYTRRRAGGTSAHSSCMAGLESTGTKDISFDQNGESTRLGAPRGQLDLPLVLADDPWHAKTQARKAARSAH